MDNILNSSGAHGQSYWFVLREDQNNEIVNNNFAVQNSQITGETRYLVGTSDTRNYINLNDTPSIPTPNIQELVTKLDEKTEVSKDVWDVNKVKQLLTLCLHNGVKNSNQSTDKDDLMWNGIANAVEVSIDECIKKYINLRRTFFRLLQKKNCGKDIKWVHYSMCEVVFKHNCLVTAQTQHSWDDNKIRNLLNLYIENLHRFHNPEYHQKDIWKEIALQIGVTEYSCFHKFRNLKRNYLKVCKRIREMGKQIKWPYTQYFERIFFNQDPAIGTWDRIKIKLLLEAYTELGPKFRNPKFKKKELWRVISSKVGKSPTNCDRKFRNLKQTFIKLKTKINSGALATRWRYYRHFEQIYANSMIREDHKGTSDTKFCKCPEEDYIEQLLTFYIENKDKFRDPLMKKKSLWKVIGPKIGLSAEECNRKFRNLKQTYVRLAEKKRDTGKCNKWPYFRYFEQIYDEQMNCNSINHINNDNILSELRRVVQDVHGRRQHDTKFERLISVVKESNEIQKERNRILQALLETT